LKTIRQLEKFQCEFIGGFLVNKNCENL